jgi:hypothetical protein
MCAAALAAAISLAQELPRWVAGFDYTPEYAWRNLSHRPGENGASTDELRARQPFVLYELGRNITRRNFRVAEGAMTNAGRTDIPQYGTAEPARRTFRLVGEDAAGCQGCHSTPPGQPGFGAAIGSTSPAGRRTTHMFGVGLVEMIGQQIRAEIARVCRLDPAAFVTRERARRGCRLRIPSAPGQGAIDFGDFQPDAFGVPQVNATLRIWFVNAEGRPVAVSGLDDSAAAGFDFAVNLMGWGRGRLELPSGATVPMGGEASTIREIFASAARQHMGLMTADPVLRGAGAGITSWSSGGYVGGRAGTSALGAQQWDFGVARGSAALTAPSAGGGNRGLSQGDLDAAEFFLLHLPAPHRVASRGASAGARVFNAIGCAGCHVPNWHVSAADPLWGHPGDRRLFHLETHDTSDGGMAGSLVRTMEYAGDLWRPRLQAVEVTGIYSDFKSWDIGPRFHEQRYDGSVQREHRTAPLWGIGSQNGFGHTGEFATLDAVITAHAGKALQARRHYQALSRGQQQALRQFLDSLILYHPQEIPADVDGDGVISERFASCGQVVGYERFDARLLFDCPLEWQVGPALVDWNGLAVPTLRLLNQTSAFRRAPGQASGGRK